MSASDLIKRMRANQAAREQYDEGYEQNQSAITQQQIDMMNELTGKQIAPEQHRDLVSLLHVDAKGNLSARGITITKVGLIIPDGDGESHWTTLVRLVRAMLQVEGSVAWIVGDALAQMQRTHKVTYEKFAEMFDREVKTLQNWCSIAQAVDISRRREVLSFSHHAEVALIDPDSQEELLAQAEEFGWSVPKLRRVVAGHPDPVPASLVDKAMNYAQRIEMKAAKMPRSMRLELADEFERVAGRLRLMEGD